MEITAFRRLIGVYCVGLLMAGAGEAQTYFEDVSELAIHARATAIGDFDNDGWSDIFRAEDSGRSETKSNQRRIVLLHNEGNGRYANLTSTVIRQEEIPQQPKGGGAIWGDYDNDGDLDIFVPIGCFWSDQSSVNALLRNDKGFFRNVTQEAGIIDINPSDNAIWLDYDRDGYLDLLIGNAFTSELATLYHNNGNGTFSDVTEEMGLEKLAGVGIYGLVAGDFNDDNWPDLYMGIWNDANRLFLSNAEDGLVDATTSDIADVGISFGTRAGDIDNDGDLDIFQAVVSQNDAGWGSYRSIMLLNLGDGQFLDVTEGVGLVEFRERQTVGPGLIDVDNDGDLDLIIAEPPALYINNGFGSFSKQTSQLGIEDAWTISTAGDLDLDGFLDICFGGTGLGIPGKLYHNMGNSNHYLQIELVGIQSNRNGIGARLMAITQDLHQIREIFGGFGFDQDEMVAHFGLGNRTQVDQLEIRWPSGQIDTLTDIPADQKIRVIEGKGEYYAVHPTIWEVPPPESIEYGQKIDFIAVAKPALFEPTAEITAVTGDLSSLGGPEAVPLEDLGDGTYKLEANFVVGGTSELRDVEVFIEQETSLGEYWINLSRNIDVNGDPNTAITESYSTSLPDNFSLHQNYPNPFNSSTTIRFSLPTPESISLSIFNLTGQKVASLVSGSREAGEYTIYWDGKDDDGNELASGIYVYRLKSSTYDETKKLLLLR